MKMRFAVFAVTLSLNMGVYSVMAQGTSDVVSNSRRRVKDIVRNNPEQIGALLQEALTGMKEHIDNPDKFERERTFLTNIVQAIQGSNRTIPADVANPVAESLIDLYRSRIQKFPGRGGFVVDFVARFGSSTKAENFVLQALAGQPAGLKEPATNALCWSQSFRGNSKIIDRLARNFRANRKDALSLAAMSRLDINQARSTIQEQITAARDVRSFNEVAGIVSQTHDVELIKALLAKVKSFRVTGRDEFKNPYIGFYSEAIASYIESTEDADLEKMLEILPTVGAGYEEKAALLKKLQDGKSSRSRRGVAKAIEGLANQGILTTPDVAVVLERQARDEKDSEAAAAMEKASQVIRSKIKPTR
jgi:hypothetical protein